MKGHLNKQTTQRLLVLFHRWMSLLSLWVARQVLNDPFSQKLTEELLLWVSLLYMTWKLPYTFKVIVGLWPKTVCGLIRYACGSGSGQDSIGCWEGSSWPGLLCVGVRRASVRMNGAIWKKRLSLVLCSLSDSQSLCPLWVPPQCLLLTPISPSTPSLVFSGPRLYRLSGFSPSGLRATRWGG